MGEGAHDGFVVAHQIGTIKAEQIIAVAESLIGQGELLVNGERGSVLIPLGKDWHNLFGSLRKRKKGELPDDNFNGSCDTCGGGARARRQASFYRDLPSRK